MQKTNNRWDRERAAAWLRRHGWGDAGEEQAPPLEPQQPQVAADAALAEAEADEEIDIAGWPALVAPFYD